MTTTGTITAFQKVDRQTQVEDPEGKKKTPKTIVVANYQVKTPFGNLQFNNVPIEQTEGLEHGKTVTVSIS